MSGLVIDKQNVSDSKGDLYQMILELRNEVNELMKSKKWLSKKDKPNE